MKYGHIDPATGKGKRLVPLTRLSSDSSRTAPPVSLRLMEETNREEIRPETVWARERFALGIS